MKKLLFLMLSIALFISCTQVTAPAEVVSLNGEPEGPHTSVEWKVWAYSTAAPSYIAANCTVVDVDGTVLREGTNGWTAMAANPRGMSDPKMVGKTLMRQCQWLVMDQQCNGQWHIWVVKHLK